MGKAIGIDLGTTNSVAAFKLADVQIIPVEGNTSTLENKLMRSVVAYDQQDRLTVGNTAYNQLRYDPENTIVSVKRLMGRGFKDPAVQKQQSHYAYKIIQPKLGTDNSLSVLLGKKESPKEYQPEDISAEILKKVVQNAKDYFQKPGKAAEAIDQAVITIPAYFNDKQRHATRTAALKAGLTPLELLAEPTAAAISYSYSPHEGDAKTILVYDFGGGTFDACLVTAVENSFIEHGKAGDMWLGGDDIDLQIVNFVKEQVAKQEGLSDINGLIDKMPYYQKVRFNADLRIAVEQAKIELSSASIARINPSTPLLDELGIAVSVEVEISRQQFEPMIASLVERSIKICHEALHLSEHTPNNVDVVLLVGGSSQIPYVQKKVREAFGNDKVVVHPQPMYAVAEGAAIVAAGLTNKATTVSRNYYIQLESEPLYKVIPRGEFLPVTTSHTFKTVVDGQRLIHFKFFNPDEVRERLDGVKDDEPIGQMWLGLEQHYPSGTEILVNLELDENNNSLRVTATLKNDPSVNVSCSFSRGKSDEKIYKELNEAIASLNKLNLTDVGVKEALKLALPIVQAANQIVDVSNGQERIDIRERAQANLRKFQDSMSKERLDAEYLAHECVRLVELYDLLIPQPQQERLKELARQLEAAIKNNNASLMQSLPEAAKQEFKNLPDDVKLVEACIDAFHRAKATAPAQARVMGDKVGRMLEALKNREGREVERLLEELRPDIIHWLNQDLATNSIATGLTR